MSRDLWECGVREVLVFVTDGLPRREEAIRRIFPNADRQQCLVHKARITLTQVRKGDEVMVMVDLRPIYTAESPEGAKAAWEASSQRWG